MKLRTTYLYVSIGTIAEKGSYAVFRVDMPAFKTDGNGNPTTLAKISKVADVPDALFLNGSAVLNREKGIILLADSILGMVWSLQLSSGKFDDWLRHKRLEKVTENPMMPGVNGIKVYNGYLYLSNTDDKTFLRTGITASGAWAGELELLEERLNVDDFAFDVDGSSYLTTHVFQSVVRLRSDGTRSRVAKGAGDKTCAGTTAAAFGRTVNDRSSLYLTTNGGMSYPVDGEVGSARLLKIKVGHAGA